MSEEVTRTETNEQVNQPTAFELQFATMIGGITEKLSAIDERINSFEKTPERNHSDYLMRMTEDPILASGAEGKLPYEKEQTFSEFLSTMEERFKGELSE